jgi:predicted DNA-binding transcriptional regulator AlpA
MSEANVTAAAGILDDYMGEAECAKELGVAQITLARWRVERRGPPVTKIGRRVFYRRASIQDWVAAQEQQLEHPKQAAKRAGGAA